MALTADLPRGGTAENGEDRSGLYRLPRIRSLSGRAVSGVTRFGDRLAEEHGVEPVTPEERATVAGQIAFWRAWRRSFSLSLLKHLKSAARKESAVAAGAPRPVVNLRGRKPATTAQGDTGEFLDNLSPDLLASGFRGSSNTPHRHRHAQGQRLRRAGVPRKVRQVVTRQKSASAQDVCTEADAAEAAATLPALHADPASTLCDLPLPAPPA